MTGQLKRVSWKKWSNSLMLHVSIMKTNSLQIQNLTIAWCRCWWCTLYMARNVLSRSRGTHVGSFSSLNHACLFQFTFRTTLISILGVHNSTINIIWDYLLKSRNNTLSWGRAFVIVFVFRRRQWRDYLVLGNSGKERPFWRQTTGEVTLRPSLQKSEWEWMRGSYANLADDAKHADY